MTAKDRSKFIALSDDLRYACQCSLWVFGRVVCQRERLRHEHLEWERLAEIQRGLFLMPRESLKTTWFVEMAISKAIMDDPGVRVLLICDTAEHAWERMRAITKHLSSPIAEWYCPGITGRMQAAVPRSQSILQVSSPRGTIRAGKEPTLTVSGILTSQTGGHYDFIVCDDIVNEDDRSSRAIRRQKEDWLPTVFDLLAKGGKLHFIGTRWFESDIYGLILKDYGSFFETYSRGIFNLDGSLWLEETYGYRLELLQQKPIHFAHQYLNEPVAGVDIEFDRDWFAPIENPDVIWTVIGLDPSYSERDVRDACDTAATVWGVTRTNEPVILDAVIERLPLVDFQREHLLRLYREWNPDLIFCEDNGVQKAALSLMQVNQLHYSDPDYADMERMVGCVVGTQSRTADKVLRAQPMKSYAMTQGIKYRKCPGVDKLLQQLYLFPVSDRNDGVDSAVHGFNGIREQVYTKQERTRSRSALPRREKITSIRGRLNS